MLRAICGFFSKKEEKVIKPEDILVFIDSFRTPERARQIQQCENLRELYCAIITFKRSGLTLTARHFDVIIGARYKHDTALLLWDAELYNIPIDTTMLPWIEKADYVRCILHTLTRSQATLFNTVEAASRNFALICASPLFMCLTITYMVSEFGLFSGEHAQRNFERVTSDLGFHQVVLGLSNLLQNRSLATPEIIDALEFLLHNKEARDHLLKRNLSLFQYPPVYENPAVIIFELMQICRWERENQQAAAEAKLLLRCSS